MLALGCEGSLGFICAIRECQIVYFWLTSLVFGLISLVQRKKLESEKESYLLKVTVYSDRAKARTRAPNFQFSFLWHSLLFPPLSLWLSNVTPPRKVCFPKGDTNNEGSLYFQNLETNGTYMTIAYFRVASHSMLPIKEEGNGLSEVESKVSSVWKPILSFIVLKRNS